MPQYVSSFGMKNYGHIIIPIVIPSNVEANKVLDDNERYKEGNLYCRWTIPPDFCLEPFPGLNYRSCSTTKNHNSMTCGNNSEKFVVAPFPS